MARRRTIVFWPLLLTLVSVVLAWSIYAELTANPVPDVGSIVRISRPVSVAPAPPAAEFSFPPIEAFAGALARPIFSQTRRPPVDDVVAVIEPDPTLDVSLRGVILSGEERIALIIPAGGTEIVRLKENEQFEGWTLIAVEPDQVVFRRDVEELTVELSFDQPVPVPQVPRSRRRQRRDPGAVRQP